MVGVAIFWVAVLIVSLIALIKAADFFTVYSEKLGLFLGVSSFIIGATIVAIGTSLPELVSSLYAVISAGAPEFVVDNIVGSNIANALLILGIGAVVARTLKVDSSLIDVDLPFFFMSMAVFVLFALDKQISFAEGATLLGFFVVFIVYSIRSEKDKRDKDEMEDLEEQFDGRESPWWKRNGDLKQIFKYLGVIAISAVVIAIAAKYLIDSILTVSSILNISSSTLTITVVAFGTSLPEILTSIAAIKLGNHAMAIGNVLGSNTFNLLLIAGVPALFGTLPIEGATFALGIPFLIGATFIAIFTTIDNRVRVWEGIAMLFLYLIFIGKITGLL